MKSSLSPPCFPVRAERSLHLSNFSQLTRLLVPNVWIRPPDARNQADAAKALLTVRDGDHLTMLNVYNQYVQSRLPSISFPKTGFSHNLTDKYDKSWLYNHFLSARVLAEADKVRAQLGRIMTKYEVDLVSLSDEKKLYQNIRQVLVYGFFMQVAHKEGEKGNYLTVKDNQVHVLCLPSRLRD